MLAQFKENVARRKAASGVDPFAARVGSPAAQQKSVEQPKSAPAQAEQPAATAAEGSRPDPMDAPWERARTAMLRSGMKDDEFRKLDRREAIRRGRRAQAELDRRAAEHSELERLRKLHEQKEGQNSGVSTTTGTQSGMPPVSVDDPLPEPFAQFDDDEKQAVKDLLKQKLDEQVRQYEAKLNATNRPTVDQEERFGRVLAKVTESFPDLADDGDRQLAMQAASGLKDLPRFKDWETSDEAMAELLTEAARVVELEEVGERDGSAAQQGAGQWGSLDVTGRGSNMPRSEGPAEGTPEHAREAMRKAFFAERSKRRGDSLAAYGRSG